MVNDPYQVLGVSHDADEDTIRQAYRRLAKKYHPDLNPGDAAAAQKMNEINEAYDLIKNPQAYQQQRAQQQAQQQARQAYQRQQQAGYYDPFDPFGFYRQSGSQSGQNASGQNSSDQQYNTYYYHYTNDDPTRQQYQWTYHRPRRSPLGIVGKILVVYFVFQLFFSLFGSCVSRWSPYSYYYYDYGTPVSSYSAYSDSASTESTPSYSYSGFGR